MRAPRLSRRAFFLAGAAAAVAPALPKPVLDVEEGYFWSRAELASIGGAAPGNCIMVGDQVFYLFQERWLAAQAEVTRVLYGDTRGSSGLDLLTDDSVRLAG